MENSKNHPHVTIWCHSPFAIHRNGDRVLYYPDGMQLMVEDKKLDLTLIENIRVNNGYAEHKFSCSSDPLLTGGWNSIRIVAYHDCLNAMQITCPRTQVSGPCHPKVQQGILARFSCQLIAGPKSAKTKKTCRVTWGDKPSARRRNENVPLNSRYGGWGLTSVKIIPNREQLCVEQRKRQRLMVEEEEEEDDNEDFSLEPVEYEEPEQDLVFGLENFVPDTIFEQKQQEEEEEVPIMSKVDLNPLTIIEPQLLALPPMDETPLSPPPLGDKSMLKAFSQSTTVEDPMNEIDSWLLQNEALLDSPSYCC